MTTSKVKSLHESLISKGFDSKLTTLFSYSIDKKRDFYIVELPVINIDIVKIGIRMGFKFEANILHKNEGNSFKQILVYHSVPMDNEYEFVEE